MKALGRLKKWFVDSIRVRTRSVLAITLATLFGVANAVGDAFLPTLQGDFSVGAWIWALVSVSVAVLVIVDEVHRIRDEPTVTALNERLTKANSALTDTDVELTNLFETILEQQVFKYNNLGPTERVAFYALDDKRFVRLARFAVRPDYARPGRTFLRKDFGCVGRAWSSKQHEYYTSHPKGSASAHADWQVDTFGLHRQEAEQLTMKTWSYASYVLHRRASSKVFGVLVFESTETDVLDRGKLRRFVKSERGAQFSAVAERVSDLQKPSIAANAGF